MRGKARIGVTLSRNVVLGHKPLDFLARTEAHRVGVDVDKHLHPASAGLAHAAPVLERIAYKGVRRNGGYGLVEVLHLDSCQRHLAHKAVRPILLHGYPVAGAQHVVGRQLYTCHKTEYGVLEYQHQHGSRRAETCQHGSRALVNDYADDEHAAHYERQQIEHLVNALKRTVAQPLVLGGNVVKRMQELAGEQQRHDYKVNVAHLEQHRQHAGRMYKHIRQRDIPDDRRYDAAKRLHHTRMEKVVVPSGLGLLRKTLHCRHHNEAEQGRTNIREQRHGEHRRKRINPYHDVF